MHIFPLFLSALLSASSPHVHPGLDCASIALKPRDARSGAIRWIAFDDTGRPVGRGTTPTTIGQAAEGVGVTYCAESETVWLELRVEVKAGHIDAWGHCTRVTVKGQAVQTTGVSDPRVSALLKAGVR